MRPLGSVAGIVGLLAVTLAGCGDDGDAGSPTTAATVVLGDPLAVGATYEDPTGLVTITVRGIRVTNGLLLATAEACTAQQGVPGIPIQPSAWQLRVEGREQTIPRLTLEDPIAAARPVWPDEVTLGPGECFQGKVAFRLPQGARPTEIVFSQLNPPVAWRVRT